MTYYDIANKKTGIGNLPNSNELFIICYAEQVPELSTIYGFDKSTVLECTDLEESVRYAAFEGYDFISAVLLQDDTFTPEELNYYAAPGWHILVLPDEPSKAAQSLVSALTALAETLMERNDLQPLNRIYYMFWQGLLAQYSDLLQQLEVKIEELSESILKDGERNPFASVDSMRRQSYKAKKYLRALAYLCTQIVTDSNSMLDTAHARLFKGVEMRMQRLYEFAESLYIFSGELLQKIRSRIDIRTNQTMSTLTVITLFFAPLTVITGIYGMNFRNMPELSWRFGYLAAIGVMVLVCAALWWIAKRKKWM